MSKNYIKLQNQGNIYQNLMLLNEMNESIGYADENGYYSKRAVAEIAINSAVVTSAGKMGDDIIALVNDTVSDESRNSVLQNAKQRMQILRVLGLVASDYDAEQYAITDLGQKVLKQHLVNYQTIDCSENHLWEYLRPPKFITTIAK